MNETERAIVREWLRTLRGKTPQAELAADITATTGWNIGRERYSKYESGGTPFGAGTLQHFIDYWAAKGQPGPELHPKPPESANEAGGVTDSGLAAALVELAKVQALQTTVLVEVLSQLRDMSGVHAEDGARLAIREELAAELAPVTARMTNLSTELSGAQRALAGLQRSLASLQPGSLPRQEQPQSA